MARAGRQEMHTEFSGKTRSGRRTSKLADNIQMDRTETGQTGVDWNLLVQDSDSNGMSGTQCGLHKMWGVTGLVEEI